MAPANSTASRTRPKTKNFAEGRTSNEDIKGPETLRAYCIAGAVRI
jgi:hypothetical protein